MSKISAMMETGRQSLANSQTALQTVGHNIANKTTEGFSRQRVEMVTNEPVGESSLRIGMGARAGTVSRINNPYLEKQMQKEGMNMGFNDSRADALGRVEQIYNEQMNKGLNQYMMDFFNAFRELSSNPESLVSRTMVRDAAIGLQKDFGRVIGQLQSCQEDIDQQIKTTVTEINAITKEIGVLNGKIQTLELQKIPPNDERDRRDVLLKKLSEMVNISWAESNDGVVSVTAGRVGVLVSGLGSVDLKAQTVGKGNRVQVIYEAESGSRTDITEQLNSGRLGGVLEVRDKTIEDLITNVDKMAFALATEVNNAHMAGVDQKGRSAEYFFKIPKKAEGAAAQLTLNQSLFNDVTKISAGAIAGAPGDNTVANLIAALQGRAVMEDGTATLDDFYNTQVGEIGAITQRAVKSQESQRNIVTQLGHLRESISGVSLDEETTKMLEFQKMYDASARLVKTADEMMDTVLNIKRL